MQTVLKQARRLKKTKGTTMFESVTLPVLVTEKTKNPEYTDEKRKTKKTKKTKNGRVTV